MIRSAALGSEISASTVSTSGSAAGFIDRAVATTAQPCLRYPATRAAPMPCEPPVMTATCRSASLMPVLPVLAHPAPPAPRWPGRWGAG